VLVGARGPVEGFSPEARELDTAAAGLERRLDELGRSLSDRDAPVPEHDGSAARDRELRAVVSRCLGALPREATAADVRNALRLAWTSDWIAFAGHAADRIERPLAEARAGLRHRWWR
jgi:hypothetical protein